MDEHLQRILGSLRVEDSTDFAPDFHAIFGRREGIA
jgi:hypothetical protein